MSMQIPDYAMFAQAPASARRQSLEMIKRFAGKHAATLYLQVYQFDPDADIREFARAELAAQGITPPTDPTPIAVQPSAASSGASFVSTESSGAAFSFDSIFESSEPPAAFATNLDGGTGRPIQRGPQHANVFTLTRGNREYLTGERAHLQHSPFGYLLTIGILAAVFAVLFFVFRMVGSSMPIDMMGFTFDAVLGLVGAIFAFVTLIMLGVWIWNIRRNRRYEREGQLLLGKILSAHGRWHTSTDGDGHTSRSYRVKIAYRVRLPDGKTYDSESTQTRGDLARGGLPAAGDPVAVLAIDAEHMRLL